MAQKPPRNAERKFVVKTYSKKQLRELYEVSTTTFGNWLKRISRKHPAEFPPERGSKFRILTPAQVAKIVEELGKP